VSRTVLTALAAALVLSALAPVRAQCSDPAVPQGGFAVAATTNVLVTHTDQYRTRADVRHPSAASGSCGWPLLIGVHGFPANKDGAIATQAAEFASQGYFVVTYDVRGQGSGVALNPGRGTTLMALAEWIDMFEMVEWAEANWPALVDRSRVGVFGISQGGAHSWAAAAYSGRVPPPNARRSAPFPVVHAVAPGVMVPSHTQAGTLQGTAFNETWATLAFQPPTPTVAIDPSFRNPLQSFLLADDPAGMRAWMLADTGRDFAPLLAQSTVPVFCRMAWLDETMGANDSIRALDGMPAATPRRLQLTTGLHGTPTNAYEELEHSLLRRQWFDRFLKGAREPVELGPPVLSAVIPGSPSAYLAGGNLWRHRADTSFPPPDATDVVWHLRSGAALAANAPSTAEPAEVVSHVVPAGYDALAWLADGSGQNLATVFARIPQSAHAYTTPPLAVDTEVAGIPRLQLEVTPQQQRFFLSARLECVTPTGLVQLLSIGHSGFRQQNGPAPARVEIELRATNALCLAGSRLRLTVSNHALNRPASVDVFDYMPQFSSYAVALEHSAARPSRLFVPVRPFVGIDCATSTTSLPVANAGPVTFSLRSSSGQAFGLYAVLASLSGQGPAFTLPGGAPLFLVPDPVTDLFAGAANSTALQGFLGTLDAAGSASATLDLRALGAQLAPLRGLHLHLAPVALWGNRIEAGAPRMLRFD